MGTNRTLRVVGTWVFAFVIVMACATAAFADETWWQHDPTETGLWFEPSNWTNGVPGAGWGKAYIDNDGTALIIVLDAETQGPLYVGYQNTGAVIQGSGTMNTELILGELSGSTGTYTLDGGTFTSEDTRIGYYGNGVFEQTGGTAFFNCGSDYGYGNKIGGYSGSYGICRLSGGSQEYYKNLNLAFDEGSEGLFELSGTGEMSVRYDMTVGRKGTGRFVQTGGTITIEPASSSTKGTITLGEYTTGDGTYELSAGQLQARNILVGLDDAGMGAFMQSGGTVTVDSVEVGANGRYVLSGGNLNFAYRFLSRGQFDFDNGSPTLVVPESTTLDLGQSTIANASNASIHAQANTLTIFPSGFDPATDLASYSSAGITHIKGTTLVVPAGIGFIATTEIDDMIHCYGTISSSNNAQFPVYLNGGLKIFEGGLVDSGTVCYGYITVDNLESGMTGGELTGENRMYVGKDGAGRFEQTGGAVTLNDLRIGYESGSEGTYILSGDAHLTVSNDTGVGSKGDGLFIQNGGIAAFKWLTIGCNPNSGGPTTEGTYELHDGLLTTANSLYVGYNSGIGHFLQTGGSLNVGNSIVIGHHHGGPSDFEITNGSTEANFIDVGGPEEAKFIQRGGSVCAHGELFIGGGYAWSSPAAGSGRYELIDGTLTAGKTTLGHKNKPGLLVQTGGSYQTDELTITSTGRYEYSAGQLSIGNLLTCDGEFDFTGSTATLSTGTGGCWDFRLGSLMNVSNTTMTVGENTLAMFPAGFDPNSEFADYQCAGVTYVVGNTMVIPAGVSIMVSDADDDRAITDHVECAGSLAPRESNHPYLTEGLFVHSGGSVDLGSNGRLYIDNLISGITDGSLKAEIEIIGNTGAGQFIQTGGSNTIADDMYLGDETGSSGTYILRGNGQIQFGFYGDLRIGRNGYGHFIQENGSVKPRIVIIGSIENGEGEGLYEMHDGRLRTERGCSVGNYGPGTFLQTGGEVNCEGFTVGSQVSGLGRYELSDGRLDCDYLNVGGSGEGHVIQTGGLVNITSARHYYNGYMSIGSSSSSGSGTYELIDGELYAENAYIGDRKIGTFIQTGGTAS
ncbi:MAG: hypothetical protein KAV00_14435, partial [Phycisphaerae bacterium]|nr:hypothetical protein [Phycisphaerae bacterium]